MPVDFDGLMMLAAPRPLLILSSEWEFYNRRNLLDKCLTVAQFYRDWRDDETLPSVIEARRERKSYEKTLSCYKERYDLLAWNKRRPISARSEPVIVSDGSPIPAATAIRPSPDNIALPGRTAGWIAGRTGMDASSVA